jgi:2-phosphosulfolactate phosphatase
MSDAFPDWSTQSGFDIRLCWGPVGLRALARQVATVVIVDVLRFTTALDVAVSVGAQVYPAAWPHDATAGPREGAEVADGTGRRGLSLSPATLSSLRAGERIVLPSANGSHCCALAVTEGVTVVGGSLRNAEAVARWHLARAAGSLVAGPLAVVPCGERWPDGSLRPAVEDLIGAGAIVAALEAAAAGLTFSPEAMTAGAAYRSVVQDLYAAVAASASGRELSGSGRLDDIAWATDLDSSDSVPVLGADGAFTDGSDRSTAAGGMLEPNGR